ncbi:MAG: ATP-binding cassette domain-containing protein [Magnetococcales bacterium]|nr:ATP-binding cassette domain-containing protein [Magnetococcales bacterium]
MSRIAYHPATLLEPMDRKPRMPLPLPLLTSPAMSRNRVLLRRWAGLIWPHRWAMIPAVISMLVLSASEGAIAYMVQPILDKIFIEQNREMFLSLPLLVLVVFLVRGAASFTNAYIMGAVGMRIARKLQCDLYNHCLRFEMAYFLSSSAGSFISRISNDPIIIKDSTASVMVGMIREGMTLIVLVGVLFYRDPVLALVALLGFPLSAMLIYRLGKKIRSKSHRAQELLELIVSHLEETFSGIRIVKSFCMESHERAQFRLLTKRVLRNHLDILVINSLSKPSIEMISGFVICGVILYGGGSVIEGKTTTGNFFSFLTAMMMAYDPIKALTNLNNALQRGLAAVDRVFTTLDRQPAILDTPESVPLPGLQRELAFNEVSFSYGDGLPNVLERITLRGRAGEQIALVGRSGSGKSTLANLLPRFFEVTEGAITLDGRDIRSATLASLRDQISVVTQEVILFNDTVKNNITYGRSEYTQERLEAVAEAANALEFIRQLPQGFDTPIGDRGVRLSGGQRQRLSIARSLLKNAPILILDEATSSLDTESERAVQEALERLMAGRTTLIIAHRLSTIRNADRIVVLKDARIVEEGNHETLLALNGEYARLHALHFQEEETPPATEEEPTATPALGR